MVGVLCVGRGDVFGIVGWRRERGDSVEDGKNWKERERCMKWGCEWVICLVVDDFVRVWSVVWRIFVENEVWGNVVYGLVLRSFLVFYGSNVFWIVYLIGSEVCVWYCNEWWVSG